IAFTHRGDQLRQGLEDGGVDIADTDRAVLAPAGQHRPFDQAVRLGEDRPGGLHEHPARLGQPDDRPPLEQRHAQFSLEAADLPAQRRLRHHKPLGRSLEPAFFRHGYHVAHEPKIKGHTRRVSRDNITGLGHSKRPAMTLVAVSEESNSTAWTPGRLAEVIATRGGQAPPEAPFVIEHREALIYILCQAAELEHGIMAQYLFAAFSLKQSAAEGLTDAEAAAGQRWRKQIMHIAAQEMLHLALVQNLLSSIGAAPHLSRPNFPQPASHYPAGVHLMLLPFGEQALRHFMFLERPEGMALDDADGLAAFNRAAPLVQAGDIVPRGQDFATVGHLYRSIEAGIARLTGKYGEEWLFVGPPRAQATAKHFRWPELVAVTDVASAQRAIDEILEQGEGPRGAWQDAHFGQFVAILDEFERLREANRAFEPARPVIAANVRPSERDPGCLLVTDPAARQVMDLFNVCYEILLLAFQRFFAHTEETDTQLTALADATVALMIQVIKPLGDLITALPAGPEYPGQTAGPSFELFYESDYLLPHRDAAWALLAERLHVAAGFAQEIIIGDTGAGGPVLTPEQLAAGAGDPIPASERVAAVVGPAGAALAGVAAALAAFLPPSDPHSPAATGPDSVRAASPADPDLAALQARANDFHLTGPDGLRPG